MGRSTSQWGLTPTSGEHREIELKPGGREIPVNFDTRQEYVAWYTMGMGSAVGQRM